MNSRPAAMSAFSRMHAVAAVALLSLWPALAGGETAVRAVPTAEPPKAGEQARGVALKRMKFAQLANSAVGESAGNAACSDGKPVYLDRKLAATLAEAITFAFGRNLRDYGYRRNPGDESVFTEAQKKPVEIEVGALVQDVQMAYCSKPGGVEGSLYFKARMELLAPAAQKVVHAPVIEGGVGGLRAPTVVEFYRAGADALVKNFLAEPGVVAWLGGEKPLPPAVARKDAALRLDPVTPPAGGTAGDATLLRASVVTIEGGGRSGSGFVVSRQGYVLTNQHVVGGNRFVKLRLASGRELVGEVVQQDMARDVALVRTESGLDPLALRAGDLAPGETVYAIGSPLGEKFSGSLTRGIVSAYRVRNGQRFIQSDVAILSGSSGGPLLDEQGRVVGLTQSGVEAGRARINLFVPIADGLKALGVALPE